MPDLNSEVIRLQRQITKQLEAARHNEQVHNKFQAIELALLSAKNFSEIAAYLQGDFKKTQSLGAVSLIMLDPENEISSALCSTNGRQECPPGMMLTHNLLQIDFLQSLGKSTYLDLYEAEDHQWLFKNLKESEGSIVVLPFIRRDQLIGCLALFSKDTSRYKSGAATEFLERLAAITAICVENCLNYEQLRRLGLTDALTGLANRRELEKWMNIEISRSLRETLPLSCLYLDVDYFKKINDKYGHDIGDQVLQEIATVMLETVRIGDIVARYGGEEFVMILPGITGLIAIETAERIRCAVANTSIDIGKKEPLKVTISIGLSSFIPKSGSIGDSGEIATELLTEADQALINAKGLGRNRVVVAD